MIKRKTVLVLGAGASYPYGFPLGPELKKKICDRICDTSTNAELARAVLLESAELVKKEHGDVAAFGTELRLSAYSSVDRFLEHFPMHRAIGKLAIALEIADYESRIHKGRPMHSDGSGTYELGDDWQSVLFEAMEMSPKQFAKNQLSVVTYNYDRSFEECLYLSLLRSAEGMDADGAKELAKNVTVVHVHGEVGIHPAFAGGDDSSREFGKVMNTAADVVEVAEGIRIVSEGVEDERLKSCRRLLEEANVVCFLGFGYLDDNLKRLQLGRAAGMYDRWVYGSAYALGWGRGKELVHQFGDHSAEINDRVCVGGPKDDAREFLFESNVLRCPTRYPGAVKGS